jgi:hypothetical protein
LEEEGRLRRHEARDAERPWMRYAPALLQATRDGGREENGFLARGTFLVLDGS